MRDVGRRASRYNARGVSRPLAPGLRAGHRETTLETSAPSPRQLVLLCDGTNNNLTGGHRDTHVVRLAELLGACPDANRLVFYDPGVGNPGELPGATWLDSFRRWRERVAGPAFGRGVYENVAESYLFLTQHYRPGDQILIFGFSRGAFTARCVAGLVNQFGVLGAHMGSLVPTLLSLYFASRGDTSDNTLRQSISHQATRLFAAQDAQAVEVHFVGVWDTVATVGMPPFGVRFTAAPTLEGKGFVHVRQALALDELRAQFKPRLYAADNGPFRTRSGQTGSLLQLWFHGAHADVGGGYEPLHSALSRVPLCWLVAEAVRCGLRLADGGTALDNEAAVSRVLARLPADVPPQATPRVNNPLHDTCIWALTGMAVRDPSRVAMDDQKEVTVKPVAHSSVQQMPLRFPQDTVWAQSRSQRPLIIALLLIPLLVLALGQLQWGLPVLDTGEHVGAWDALQLAAQHAGDYLDANVRFALWQLAGPWGGDWACAPGRNCSPQAALAWDVALIATYACALAWFASRSFARLAGLRQLGDPPARWLNRLGWALPIAVSADLAENLSSSLALALMAGHADTAAAGVRTLMMVCAAIKLVGLAATLALIVWGQLRPRR